MSSQINDTDAMMMRRCIALAATARQRREVPYAAVISRRGHLVCETINKVNSHRDVTHHAELIAISTAQRQLGRSLGDCTMYTLVEPCPMCAYALREVRMGRVVYALGSPVMGGHTHWDILGDHGLSSRIPEVFAQPPAIVAGFLSEEAAAAMRSWNPLFWAIIRRRRLITAAHAPSKIAPQPVAPAKLRAPLRRLVDRLWRA